MVGFRETFNWQTLKREKVRHIDNALLIISHKQMMTKHEDKTPNDSQKCSTVEKNCTTHLRMRDLIIQPIKLLRTCLFFAMFKCFKIKVP